VQKTKLCLIGFSFLLTCLAEACSKSEGSTAVPLACGTPGLETNPCLVAKETCPCSGFECPTYHDGFCTAVCSDELVWQLTDCGRALPFEPSQGGAGAGGEAGEAGAAP